MEAHWQYYPLGLYMIIYYVRPPSPAPPVVIVMQDLTFGGIAVANQLAHNPAYPLQPNNEDTLLSAASNSLPMDFFSYHSITTSLGIDQIQVKT